MVIILKKPGCRQEWKAISFPFPLFYQMRNSLFRRRIRRGKEKWGIVKKDYGARSQQEQYQLLGIFSWKGKKVEYALPDIKAEKLDQKKWAAQKNHVPRSSGKPVKNIFRNGMGKIIVSWKKVLRNWTLLLNCQVACYGIFFLSVWDDLCGILSVERGGGGWKFISSLFMWEILVMHGGAISSRGLAGKKWAINSRLARGWVATFIFKKGHRGENKLKGDYCTEKQNNIVVFQIICSKEAKCCSPPYFSFPTTRQKMSEPVMDSLSMLRFSLEFVTLRARDPLSQRKGGEKFGINFETQFSPLQ